MLNLDTQDIMDKAKARTTREDLTIGISECINNLTLPNPEEINIVALSTTLATNAIVEGRGCEVGVLLIGHDIIKDLPVKNYASVKGGHNIKGRKIEELDEKSLYEAVKGFEGKVEAIAISGLLSIRNPEHELRAKEIVGEVLGLPVVCAHQLTTALGFHERTVTAALNARLIPIIDELIKSVEQVLEQKGIKAPILIVKGDGSLMSEEVATEKPIETILSGPAASIVGATFLTGEEDAMVLDMGGTTTDIALLTDGVPRINAEGASVGGWLTRVEAAEVYTYGLGGDSYIQTNPKENKINVGPNRVWPLSYVVSKYPYLKKELEHGKKIRRELLFNQRSDCYVFLKEPKTNGTKLTKIETEIIELLKEGPHYIYYISEKLNSDVNTMPLSKLEKMGLIIRSSITPTDLLHVTGELDQLDKEGAILGVQLLADNMKISQEEFVEWAMEEIINKLSLTIIQSLVNIEGRDVKIESDRGCAIFLDKILKMKKKNGFDCSMSMENTVVGIGAPIRAYLPKVAKKVNCKFIIPTNAEVANAVGAATGKVIDTTKVLIKPGSEGGFIVHLPWERKTFMELEEASDFALEVTKDYARKNALRSGALEPELMVEKKDIYSKSAMSWADDVYIETRITVTAIGKPKW